MQISFLVLFHKLFILNMSTDFVNFCTLLSPIHMAAWQIPFHNSSFEVYYWPPQYITRFDMLQRFSKALRFGVANCHIITSEGKLCQERNCIAACDGALSRIKIVFLLKDAGRCLRYQRMRLFFKKIEYDLASIFWPSGT